MQKDFSRLCSPDIARGSDARGRGRGRFRGCGGGVEVIGSTLIDAARQTELTRYDCYLPTCPTTLRGHPLLSLMPRSLPGPSVSLQY